MNQRASEILTDLYQRYEVLEACTSSIEAAFDLMVEVFQRSGKMLLCGNGGSAADCDHIAAELMKGFLLARPLDEAEKAAFGEDLPDDYEVLANATARNVQKALPAISLVDNAALISAYSNDEDARFVYAQQVYALGCSGDLLCAISTSGSSYNVIAAVIAARARGMKTIALTGEGGGDLLGLADVCVQVPTKVTHEIQELHLPIYHALCAALEAEFFEDAGH